MYRTNIMRRIDHAIRSLVLLLQATLALSAVAGCDDTKTVERADGETPERRESSSDSPDEKAGSDENSGAGDEESDGDKNRSVRLSSEAQERIEIRVEQVRKGRMSAAIDAPAKIQHDLDRISHVSPLVEGEVTDVRVSLGDRVEAGEVLARMRSATLGEARAALAETRASLEVAETNFDRNQKLRKREIASERALLEAKGELEKARARHAAERARLQSLGVSGGEGPSYPLRSGIDGRVVERNVSRGETKRPGDEVFVIGDRSEVWVVGDVYESDIHRVESGMTAVVTVEAHPGTSWEGTVDWIGEELDEKSHVLPVRVVLENADGLLRPGMYGELQLMPETIDDPLPVVPVGAIQRIGKREVIFVPDEKPGSYRLHEVETGAEKGGLVDIRSGLEEADEVVTEGSFALKTALRAQ